LTEGLIRRGYTDAQIVQVLGGYAIRVLGTIWPHMQNGEPIGLGVSPAVADIDADIVAYRHLPAKLAIDVVVIV